MLAFPSMSYTKKPRTINFDRYEMIPSPFETIRSSKLPDKKHEEIIASKLYIKDLKHRQLSQFEEVIKIEAPFVMGNRMSIRLKAPITPRSYTAIIKSKRPKTVNTVFRSKTC